LSNFGRRIFWSQNNPRHSPCLVNQSGESHSVFVVLKLRHTKNNHVRRLRVLSPISVAVESDATTWTVDAHSGGGTLLQEGRTMLLTNIQNTLTINTTTGNGLVIVCGVELRGCSACRPVRFAERPSEKPAAKRPGHSARAMHAMYSDHQSSWRQPWLDSSTSQHSTSALLLGSAFSLS